MTSYIDIGINSEGDIAYENGKIKYARGEEETLQRIRTRLRKILGEWFLNTDSGIPYFEGRILGGRDFNYVRLIIRSTIAETEGVTEVKTLNLIANPQTKEVSIYAEITTNSRTIEFREEL